MKYIFVLSLVCSFSSGYVGCYSKGCTEFIDSKNSHGVILKSTGEQLKFVGYGAGTEVVKIKGAKKLKKIVLYLGKSCDAYSKLYGNGEWSWANGGFIVKFKSEEFGFGRQELDIKREEELGCRMKF